MLHIISDISYEVTALIETVSEFLEFPLESSTLAYCFGFILSPSCYASFVKEVQGKMQFYMQVIRRIA